MAFMYETITKLIKRIYEGSTMKSNYKIIIDKFNQIIELSKEICKKADWWYYETHEPISRSEINRWYYKTGMPFPEEYIACLSVTNGFRVDFSSTVGYFHIAPFPSGEYLERYFTTEMQKRSAQKISFKQSIGWINHRTIYYEVFTGKLF